jgi:inner membrane protein YidH
VSSQPPREEAGPPEPRDAARRTRLANERTYLAWWRTGLGCLAVSLAAGRLVPVLAHGTRWPYTVVGVGFAAVGIAFIWVAFVRYRHVEDAIARGEFAPPDDRLIAWVAVSGAVLGLIVLVLVATAT